MVQGAVYDAVNAIDGGYQPYLGAPPAEPLGLQGGGRRGGGVRRARRRCSRASEPTLQPALRRYRWRRSPDGRRRRRAGSRSARRRPRRCSPRGPATAASVRSRSSTAPAPGEWRPTPPDFAPRPGPVGRERAAVPRPERGDAALRRARTRSTSDAYAKDFNEVKRARLAHEHDAHRGPDRRRDLLAGQRRRRSGTASSARSSRRAGPGHRRSARLFAMANLAAADGAIGCWNDKYYWNFWRPITAIREADSDGNPATVADPSWTPLFDRPQRSAARRSSRRRSPTTRRGTPASAARSCTRCRTSSAPTRSPSAPSATAPRTTRSFDGFSDALKEIIDARVWAGIHFRTADVQGRGARQEGRPLARQALLPAGGRAGQPAVLRQRSRARLLIGRR